jgi:hypothetical protein
MRTAPNYTPTVGMRVRRLMGDDAGRILTIESVRTEADGFVAVGGSYEGGQRVVGSFAERYEPINPAPAAASQPLTVGMRVEIVGPTEGSFDELGCPRAAIGFTGVVRDAPIGDDYARVETIEVGGRIRWSYPLANLRPLDVPAAPASPFQIAVFEVGQEVVISERIRNAEGYYHDYDCEVAGNFIGQHCVVRDPALDDQGLVRISWNGGRNNWQLLSQYLDAANPAEAAAVGATPPSFTVGWQLITRGQPLQSIMPSINEWLTKPIQTLSRQRGEWGSMLVVRAMLRLRRQVPNSYEEQVAKGQDYNSTVLWQRVWKAASRI